MLSITKDLTLPSFINLYNWEDPRKHRQRGWGYNHELKLCWKCTNAQSSRSFINAKYDKCEASLSFSFCSFAHIPKKMLLWVWQSASILRVWGVFETRNQNSGSWRKFRDKKSEVSGHPSATLIDQSHQPFASHRPFFSTSSKQSFPFWLNILRSESLPVIWELGQIKVIFFRHAG